MSENKESGSLNQDDIAKLLNEMQSEDTPADPEEKSSSPENKSNESTSLNQDDISKLLNDVQSEEKKTEPKEKPSSSKNQSNESASLNQDDISKLLNDVQNEEKKTEPEEKPGSSENQNNESASLNQDDVSKLLNDNQSEEKKTENTYIEKDQSKEIPDDGMMKEKTGDLEDEDSFEGLDSISDDELEIPDNEMDINSNEIAAKPADKIEKTFTLSENEPHKRKKIRIQEITPPKKRKWLKLSLFIIFSALLVTGVFFGYKTYIKPDTKMNHLPPPSESGQMATPENNLENEKEKETPALQTDNSQIKTNKPDSSVVVKLEEITNLRRKLAIKEDEIADLIKNYKEGIRQMEAEILKIKQTHQINTLHDAIKNKKIEFGMMTIQRRLAYIESMRQPFEWLNQGIEELQYLKNKIEIDSQISRVISGIDMDKMVREIDVVLQEYRTGIETLQVQINNTKQISLESIWKRIINKEKMAVSKNHVSNMPSSSKEIANGNGKIDNQMIWKEICSGYFKRKNDMTTLSAKAAKCLSKWRHVDLILNGLSDLSPAAAKELLTWKGNWVCLNGIKKLSPETAKYLFQWKGNLISLNGLPEISSAMAASLPHWQGKQLELMGLKYKKTKRERIGLKALATWEASGGKLYIPEKVRLAMKTLG